MKKLWLLALLCSVCAAAISCSDDDDVVADDNEDTSPATSYELIGAHGFYLGDSTTDATLAYYLELSDWDMTDTYYKDGYHYYNLLFLTTNEPASGTITIPEGTYAVSGTEGNNVIYTAGSDYVDYVSAGTRIAVTLSSGSLTVSVSGTATTIEGTLTDEEGTVHNISYSGTIDIYDLSSDTSSTLTEDIAVDLTGTPCDACYYGDKLDNGTAYWYLEMLNTPGEGLYLTFCGDSSFTAETGLPTGTFTGASEDEAKAGTYILGTLSSDEVYNSWFFTMTTDGYLTAPFSSLGDGTITVTRSGDGTYTISVDVMDASGNYSIKATWSGTPTITDCSESMNYSSCYYYGNDYTGGTTYEYYTLLSDKDLTNGFQAGSHYYNLQIFSTDESASGTITIPEGTYTVSEDYGDNVILASSAYYGVVEDDGTTTIWSISSGSLNVSVSGTVTTIEGFLTDTRGIIHDVNYSGTIGFNDITSGSDSNSTVTEDINADLTGAYCAAYYVGDGFGNGEACWWFEIQSFSGDCFYMTYCGESSYTLENGLLPTGEFTGADTGEKGTYVKGDIVEDYLDNSWYFTRDMLGFMVSPHSPLGDGTFTVTYNSDGTYTFDWDVMDETNTYSIKATWTGTPELYDYFSDYYMSSGTVSTLSLKSKR